MRARRCAPVTGACRHRIPHCRARRPGDPRLLAFARPRGRQAGPESPDGTPTSLPHMAGRSTRRRQTGRRRPGRSAAERGEDALGDAAVGGDVGLAVGADLDQAGAGGEGGGEVGEGLEAAVGEVEEGGGRSTETPRGVPRSGLELLAVERRCWGRKWKMPPPPLSITTIRTGVVTSRSAARPPMSWSSPRSPVTIVVGRPLAWAAPIPEEIEPVDPVGAAVAEEQDVGLARAEERLLVPDRHRGRGVDEVAVAVGARRAPGVGPAP